MIGPDLDVPGGVSAVEKVILQYPPPGVQVDFHPTLTRHGAASALQGQPIQYAAQGVRNLLSFIALYKSLQNKTNNYDLFHVHIASRGSTLRKYIVCRYLHKKKNDPMFCTIMVEATGNSMLGYPHACNKRFDGCSYLPVAQSCFPSGGCSFTEKCWELNTIPYG
jgi:hypothetical protein